MADLSSETSKPEAAHVPESIAGLLSDHKGNNVAVLDLREMGAWTDFFVIATTSSAAHCDGLERHVRDFCRENEIDILRHSRRLKAMGNAGQEDEWKIIDLGHTVIHLMSSRARDFYDLERLYYSARAHYSSSNSKSSS